MGVDIHMKLIHKDGEMINSNLYDGRDSEWFDNLINNGFDITGVYNELQKYIEPGLPLNAAEEDKNNLKTVGYYGAHQINLADYKFWYDNYKPHVYAGWVTIYQEWVYLTKGIPVEVDAIKLDLTTEDNPANYVFREFTNEHDCNTLIIKQIMNSKNIDISNLDEYIIYFYFDC